jgi:MFS family permease
MAPGFIVTGFFFHQAPLAEAKGWSAAWMASAFIGYSVGSVGGSLLIGFIIDRFGGTRILPTYLLPLAASCGVIAATDAPLAAFAFTILMGLTSGGGQTLMGTVWAEFYGVLHLGAIRSLTMACGVVASAASPLLLGVLIDSSVSMQAIALGCMAYAIGGCGLILMAVRKKAPEAHPA